MRRVNPAFGCRHIRRSGVWRRRIAASALISMAVFSSCTAGPSRTLPGASPVESVHDFDVGRYMGLWYEISKYPNFFERGLVGGHAFAGVLLGPCARLFPNHAHQFFVARQTQVTRSAHAANFCRNVQCMADEHDVVATSLEFQRDVLQ